LPALDLLLRPTREADGFSLRINVANQSAKVLQGALELCVEAAEGEPRRWPLGPVAIAAQSTETITRPAPAEACDALRTPQVWRVTIGEHRSRPVRVGCGRWSRAAPTIDGDLSEWDGLAPLVLAEAEQVWQGTADWTPADASCRACVWFTPEALHVAAEIKDDDPLHNGYPPLQLYRGDAVEIYLGVAGPTARTVIDKRVEFQIALTGAHENGGGPLAVWYHQDEVLKDARVASRRTADGYTLEAAIPLAALNLRDFRPEPGQLLAFDVTLDDRDPGDWAPAGVEPGRRLSWNGGGANWINPSGYGLLVLEAR
jgi:hypothetical protein